MDEFIKLLDANLEYINHKIIDDTTYINVKSNRKEVQCPFCGHMSSQTHVPMKEALKICPYRERR